MPVRPEKRDGVWRLVEPNGRIAMTGNGKPRDGGGHPTRRAALKQAGAINSSDSVRKAVMAMKA